MYLEFYGLSEPPFDLIHNPKFVFYTSRHREALSHLEHGLVSGSPLTVLLGTAGMGKSTILQEALQADRCSHIECIHVRNPNLRQEPMVDTLLAELVPQGAGSASPLQALHTALCQRGSRGQFTALAVDEAETLTPDALDELAELTTLQAANIQLLPIVLAGQPTLATLVERSKLRQLKDRGAVRYELMPLELAQTASYILWRARAAGALGGLLFTREAVALIHHFSKGIPRTINVICDNVLLAGYRQRQKPVTHHLVKQVCEQLDLAGISLAAATAPRDATEPDGSPLFTPPAPDAINEA